jgi:hypothetical protein
MTDLKKFLATQTAVAQSLLEELLHVHPDEKRDEVVPPVKLFRLKDDPANSKPGWCFLDDPRNDHLQGHGRRLLNRVLDEGWLQQEFLIKGTKAMWRRKTAEQYLKQVNTFLELLLLLIHILGGQPAPGTHSEPWSSSRLTNSSSSSISIPMQISFGDTQRLISLAGIYGEPSSGRTTEQTLPEPGMTHKLLTLDLQ